MQSRFRVIVQKSDYNSDLEAIHIPSLQYSLDMNSHPEERELYRKMGEQYYLENKVEQILAIKLLKNESFEDLASIALMTQGLSELNAPTIKYDVYFVAQLKDIKPKNIDGTSIVIVGQGCERQAVIIINNKFYIKNPSHRWCNSNDEIWTYDIVLDREEFDALKDIEYSGTKKVKMDIKYIAYLSAIKREIIETLGWVYLGPNSHILDISVDDCTHRPCKFFTTTLPHFTRLLAIANFGLDTVVNLGLLDAMPNPLFPPQAVRNFNATTGNFTETYVPNPGLRPFNISQMCIGVAMSLLFVFAGPRQRSVKGLGQQIDDFLINLYRRVFPHHKNIIITENNSADETLTGTKDNTSCWSRMFTSTCSNLKLRIAKGIFILLILDQIGLMIMMSYLRLNAISEEINRSENQMFSPTVIKNVILAQWILNQANDPTLIMAECNMLENVLVNHLNPPNLLANLNQQAAVEIKAKQPSRRKAHLSEVGMFKFNSEQSRQPNAAPAVVIDTEMMRSREVRPDLQQPLLLPQQTPRNVAM